MVVLDISWFDGELADSRLTVLQQSIESAESVDAHAACGRDKMEDCRRLEITCRPRSSPASHDDVYRSEGRGRAAPRGMSFHVHLTGTKRAAHCRLRASKSPLTLSWTAAVVEARKQAHRHRRLGRYSASPSEPRQHFSASGRDRKNIARQPLTLLCLLTNIDRNRFWSLLLRNAFLPSHSQTCTSQMQSRSRQARTFERSPSALILARRCPVP